MTVFVIFLIPTPTRDANIGGGIMLMWLVCSLGIVNATLRNPRR